MFQDIFDEKLRSATFLGLFRNYNYKNNQNTNGFIIKKMHKVSFSALDKS